VVNLTKKFSRSAGFADLLPQFVRKRPWLTAVNDVSLEIKEGEFFGLLGPNGAGKTTLIKMLSTLITPTSGAAFCGGHDVVKEEQMVKKTIGLISAEERSFYWRLTGRENLEFYASLYNLSGAARRARIDELLGLVGLASEADRRFQTYSTGMRQRLAIARGLLSNPKILFVDEPTKALDPVSARTVREFLRQKLAAAGRTIILATHQLTEAQELCDRVAIMNRGRIVACGTVPQLRAVFQRQDKCALLVKNLAPGVLDIINGLPGVSWCGQPVRHNGTVRLELFLADRQMALPDLVKSIVASGGEVCDFNVTEASLEEIFVSALDRSEEGRA
jgi:ABC-2 type transport system ATP-binding protein